ncbi:hypothetical protein SNOUR_42845 [Streptomyces noursei ATCC 11455]|nr:hypothetical protein SNOUR_42845 [Streptomyces noursei ATCC 11455]
MLCPHCNVRAAKLPFRENYLCIPCYRHAVEKANQDRIRRGLSVVANFVSDPCYGCDSHDVDANGTHFWCNNCAMVVRVAI